MRHQVRRDHGWRPHLCGVDDPLLTDRSGKSRRRPLVRVVIEQYLRMPPESQLAQTTEAAPVIIFACDDSSDSLGALRKRGVEVVAQGSALDLAECAR
jgi:riboflavin biosynthesis pyrimidine reductase